MADDSRLRHRSVPPGSDSGTASYPPQGQQNADPLAELARLIGQDDVFEQMRRDAARAGQDAPASAPAPARPTSSEEELRRDPHPTAGDLRGSYNANPSDPLGRRRPVETRPREEPAQTYDHGYAPAPHHHQPAAAPEPAESHYASQHAAAPTYRAAPATQEAYPETYYPEQPDAQQGAYADSAYDPAYAYDDPAYDEGPEPAPKRRGGFMAMAVVLGLVVVGTAGAVGYRAMSGGGDGDQPPVIKASPTPAKVTPAQGQAGRTERAERSGGDRMVTREEQPVELREARATPRTPTQGSTASSATVGMTGQMPGAMAPSQAFAPENPNEPKRVRTIAIKPDGTAAPESGTRSQNIRTGTQRAPAPNPTALAPQGDTRGASNPTRTASIPPAVGGTHVVQVASQKTENNAQASFRSLQGKYPDVLGGRQALIRKIDLGERGTFYRVQVGPFASADQANELCNNLKAAGGQCIVQRN